MPEMTLRPCLGLRSVALCASLWTLGTCATASPVESLWQGTLSCSAQVGSGSGAYSRPLQLKIDGTRGQGEAGDVQTVEKISVDIDAKGHWRALIRGVWRNDERRQWITRLEGSASGLQARLEGKMFAGDGVTLVRERCELQLQASQAATSAGPAQPTPGLQTAQAPSSNAHTTLRLRSVNKASQPGEAGQQSASGLPLQAGLSYLPEAWLYGQGQPWHYRTSANAAAPAVPVREPRADEQALLELSARLVQELPIKVIALIDDGQIVDVVAAPEIRFNTLLLSASMGKTVTAIATGQALCAGSLNLGTRADALISVLVGKDLGAATLHDLLRMASGTIDPPPRDVMGTTAQENRHHLEGPGNLLQLVSSPSQATAQSTFFGPRKPGERFSYKARDPYVTALMLEQATGMRAVQWVEQSLLAQVPIEYPGYLGTDRSGYFAGANGGVRLALVDWIRLAIFVQNQRRSDSCLGRYLRDMSRTQIAAPLQDGVNGYFKGYGYFTWTENTQAPDTFWAVGYGGQRIGWSTDPDNRRIFLMFSTSADHHMARIYPLANAWINPAARARLRP